MPNPCRATSQKPPDFRTGRNFRFKLCVIPPPDLDELTLAQLRELVAMLLTKMAALEQKVIEQREEIARLKGLKGRPDIKSSGMDKGTEPARPGRQGQHLRRGKVRPRVNVEDLRRFVLMQYHQGQTTLPRLATLMQSVGVAISKREIQRLLTEGQDSFLAENRDVLRAGLQTSPWISVDDTGARHADPRSSRRSAASVVSVSAALTMGRDGEIVQSQISLNTGMRDSEQLSPSSCSSTGITNITPMGKP